MVGVGLGSGFKSRSCLVVHFSLFVISCLFQQSLWLPTAQDLASCAAVQVHVGM